MEVSCTFRPSVQEGPADSDGQSDPDGIDDPESDAIGALPSDLSERILDALVDEHGRDSVEGGERAWFRKHHVKAGG
jgi:hypothetical protein